MASVCRSGWGILGEEVMLGLISGVGKHDMKMVGLGIMRVQDY